MPNSSCITMGQQRDGILVNLKNKIKIDRVHRLQPLKAVGFTPPTQNKTKLWFLGNLQIFLGDYHHQSWGHNCGDHTEIWNAACFLSWLPSLLLLLSSTVIFCTHSCHCSASSQTFLPIPSRKKIQFLYQTYWNGKLWIIPNGNAKDQEQGKDQGAGFKEKKTENANPLEEAVNASPTTSTLFDASGHSNSIAHTHRHTFSVCVWGERERERG